LDANQTYQTPIDHSSLKSLVEHFFPSDSTSTVSKELWKWFVFALSEKGMAIQNLQANEFAQFSDQLIKIVAAVHQWANLQAAAAGQEGGYHA
jgi:hypothetical protein